MAQIGPQTRTNIPARFYPQVPTGKPVRPETLNSHLRFLTDGIQDVHEACQAISQKFQTSSKATGTIGASSSVQVVVPIPSPFPDMNYTATAGVVGTQLTVGDVVLAKGSVTVTVINRDAGASHSGTVSIIVMHH